jgi:rSAM/selenodomain-associated transferase 2
MGAPRYSIIMPVLNEETVLAAQLPALQHHLLPDQRAELIVVDGGSADRTAAIAAPFGRVISAPRGRARQMNAGASAARGELLIFLHADTRLPPDAWACIERSLANPLVVGGAFRLRFDTERLAYRIVAASVNQRSKLHKSFTGDQAYVIRRAAFEQVGGFPVQPLMEDLEITRQLRRIGRFVLFPAAVTTSARRHAQIGLARTLVLMWLLRTLYRLGMSPERLHRLYLDIR